MERCDELKGAPVAEKSIQEPVSKSFDNVGGNTRDKELSHAPNAEGVPQAGGDAMGGPNGIAASQ